MFLKQTACTRIDEKFNQLFHESRKNKAGISGRPEPDFF